MSATGRSYESLLHHPKRGCGNVKVQVGRAVDPTTTVTTVSTDLVEVALTEITEIVSLAVTAIRDRSGRTHGWTPHVAVILMGTGGIATGTAATGDVTGPVRRVLALTVAVGDVRLMGTAVDPPPVPQLERPMFRT